MSQSVSKPRAKLLKTYITKSGSLYMPRVYEANVLPDACYIQDGWVEVLGEEDIVLKQEILKENIINRSSAESNQEDEITIKPVEEKIITPQVEEAEIGEKNSAEVNINTCTKAALVSLRGIGSSTADKIIEARELSPFLGISDLKERISLPLGKSWSEYSLDFSTEDE